MIRSSITQTRLVASLVLASGCAITFQFQEGVDGGGTDASTPADSGDIDGGVAEIDSGPPCVMDGAACMVGTDAGTCRIDDGALVCCTGCFVSGTGCVGGDVDAECGRGGGMCAPCSMPLSCVDQVCQIADPAVEVIVGRDVGSALLASGELWVWGGSPFSQVATGMVPATSPNRVITGARSGIHAVAWPRLEDSHTNGGCFIDDADELYCWGSGIPGYSETGTRPAPTPILVNRPSGVAGWRFVRLTYAFFAAESAMGGCAVALDSRVFCWGTFRNCGLGITPDTTDDTELADLGLTAIDLSLSESHGCLVADDSTNTVYCWGQRNAGRLGADPATIDFCQTPIALFTQARAVSVGLRHSCAVRADNTVACWGDSFNGQAGSMRADTWTPETILARTGFQSVAAGTSHTCGLSVDGEAWCWGCGYQGALGATGVESSGCWMTGAVNAPTLVEWPVPFVEISVAQNHACGRDTTGEVACWGGPSFGASTAGAPLQDTPIAIALSP